MSIFSWFRSKPKPPERIPEVGDHIMFVEFLAAHGLAGILWDQPQTGTVIAFSENRRSILIETKLFGEKWFPSGRVRVVDWLPLPKPRKSLEDLAKLLG